jgi:hypothetical protein
MPYVELNAEELAWLAGHPVVRVRIGSFPPYHFWDGGARGVSVELLEIIAQNMGFRLEYLHDMSWIEALKRIENRDGLDLLLTAKRTPWRETIMVFSKDYLELTWVIFTRDKDNRIFSLTDLFDKTVAVEEGYVLQQMLDEQYPQINQIRVKDAAEALLAVSDGRGRMPISVPCRWRSITSSIAASPTSRSLPALPLGCILRLSRCVRIGHNWHPFSTRDWRRFQQKRTTKSSANTSA